MSTETAPSTEPTEPSTAHPLADELHFNGDFATYQGSGSNDRLPDGDAGLRLALSAGQALADVAARTFSYEAEDRGTTLNVPVVLVEDGGRQRVAVLADEVRKVQDLARDLRLRDAAGPDRRVGTINAQAFDSFCAAVLRFARPSSAIFANLDARTLVAVLDYNEPGADGKALWGQHRVVYPAPLSEHWGAWGGVDGHADMSQEDFARFLDSRDRDLTPERPANSPSDFNPPTPTKLITVAGQLETYTNNKVKRERDSATQRVKLAFSTDSGFLGDVVPPPAFAIKIPIFQDSEPVALEVRLRAEVENGEASFTFGIHAALEELTAAFRVLVSRAAERTGLPTFIGTPEK